MKRFTFRSLVIFAVTTLALLIPQSISLSTSELNYIKYHPYEFKIGSLALSTPTPYALPKPEKAHKIPSRKSFATEAPSTSTPTYSISPAQASCPPQSSEVEFGTVLWAFDGDTLAVDIMGEVRSVRMIGIDAPEDSNIIEAFGPESTQKTKNLLVGRVIKLVKDVSDRDGFGQFLRYVFLYGMDSFVNYDLVRFGYARAIDSFPNNSCFADFSAAEQLAKSESLGIWAPTTPTPTQQPITPLPPTPQTIPGPCNCKGGDLDCKDFYTQSSAQACYRHCKSLGYGDIFDLDRDNDGLACEALP